LIPPNVLDGEELRGALRGRWHPGEALAMSPYVHVGPAVAGYLLVEVHSVAGEEVQMQSVDEDL
jgi:hypothetical protein